MSNPVIVREGSEPRLETRTERLAFLCPEGNSQTSLLLREPPRVSGCYAPLWGIQYQVADPEVPGLQGQLNLQ